MSWTRRWHRAASGVLLIAAGVQFSAHWVAYVAVDGFDPARRDAMRAMQAYVLHAPSGTTLWTSAGFFSFAWAAMLALFGTSQWILARETEPRSLRRHALRNAVLCALAALLLLWLHPLPHGLIIFALASGLFGCAAWPRPLDR